MKFPQRRAVSRATMRFAVVVAVVLMAALAHAGSFVTFESGQVRPLALSPSGRQLFAVNTPDARLEIFDVRLAGLRHVASVPVGLEPVAVAARTDSEVWVVNHLSDSVSIVDVRTTPPRVVNTLLVGDEPRDIVFAGPGRNRAFITTAHRGQNSRVDAQLSTPGVGRADVWVFDAADIGTALGGDPLAIVTLFCDTPRALAVSPDGGVVYAAAFHSGNQTVTVGEGAVCDGGESAACNVDALPMPGGLPAPNVNFEGAPQPETGLIVKFNGRTGAWEDAIGRDWRRAVRLSLPDLDVFAVDALASPPTVTSSFAHVGTVIYNLAVNPVSGRAYASNTEARNDIRFSGPGVFGGTSVRGHLHEARVTVIDGSGVRARHLNKHIDYATVPSPAGVKASSLATPTSMAVSPDGTTLYVAALGSNKIAIFDTGALEADTFVPDAADHIAVPGGPSGIVLDDLGRRLYVLTRFDDAIAVVVPHRRRELQRVPLYNPEPPSVVLGRPFLYDATLTSSNGEASCAGCHVFGDFDSLAWDLGDPDAPVVPNPNPVRSADVTQAPDFHPLKGPLTTQTLRGLATQGAMHWRGDRTGGNTAGIDPRNERAAFKTFNEAFISLLGRESLLTDAQMDALGDFVLQIMPPPNPIRALDNSLSPVQQEGRTRFEGCTSCHVIDPAQGFFGTDGFVALTGTSLKQYMKIPHLDNFYQKVGMFMLPPPFNEGDTTAIGDQVRGFGFTHDGSLGFYAQNADIEQFLLAFGSRLAPVVGQQATLMSGSGEASGARVELLLARAAEGECDVTVKGTLDGEDRGWYLTAAGMFRSDRVSEPALSPDALRQQATRAGQELTYTCVPPGSGVRIGVDRDEDGFYDRDERDVGTDPANPASIPFTCAVGRRIADGVLKITRARDASGAATLIAAGTIMVDRAVDPSVHGVRFSVVDRDGRLLFTRTIGPGGRHSRLEAGWTVSGDATVWQFTDPTGRKAGALRATVRDGSRGTVAFELRGRLRIDDLPTERLPLQIAVSIGDPARQCAASAFGASSELPGCRELRNGRTLLCR